jgi:hypothetical protein
MYGTRINTQNEDAFLGPVLLHQWEYRLPEREYAYAVHEISFCLLLMEKSDYILNQTVEVLLNDTPNNTIINGVVPVNKNVAK